MNRFYHLCWFCCFILAKLDEEIHQADLVYLDCSYYVSILLLSVFLHLRAISEGTSLLLVQDSGVMLNFKTFSFQLVTTGDRTGGQTGDIITANFTANITAIVVSPQYQVALYMRTRQVISKGKDGFLEVSIR